MTDNRTRPTHRTGFLQRVPARRGLLAGTVAALCLAASGGVLANDSYDRTVASCRTAIEAQVPEADSVDLDTVRTRGRWRDHVFTARFDDGHKFDVACRARRNGDVMEVTFADDRPGARDAERVARVH